MRSEYQGFVIRDWLPSDRAAAAMLIRSVLAEYGLGWEPEATDRDVLQVEEAYWATGGAFWVVEQQGRVVGTGGYYPIQRKAKAVELRKMYLLPEVRGQGLGRYLLQALEQAIAAQGFEQVWIETSSKLKAAVKLYENSGYQPAKEEELCTQRCDRVYVKGLGTGN